MIRINGVDDLDEEIFGPVLHVATFENEDLENVVSDINNRGYGLTFGLQTRIERRIDKLSSAMKVGNIYVNRNQVGAVVGSQPFGGEGLSGTGPKAGGPHYLPRFFRSNSARNSIVTGKALALETVQAAINNLPSVDPRPRDHEVMPGPTGESNELFTYARGTILCMGPSSADAQAQAKTAREQGCEALIVAPEATGENALDGFLSREHLTQLSGVDAVVCWSEAEDIRDIRKALAHRDGPLIPLITEQDFASRCLVERHVCIDTTAAGGNVSLLA